MNIPTKVLRSTFITYETYFHHQQLARRFYKSSKNSKKNTKFNVDSDSKNGREVEQLPFPLCEYKQNFKDELLKW